MKIALYFSICMLTLLAPAYAGSETLTTYYPAPTGVYNKMQTNYMQLGSSTLTAIQAQYNCSYDPLANLPPCPAGIIYYDTDAHTLFFSDGTHWKMVVSSCVPLVVCPQTMGCSSDSCGNSCGSCTAPSVCSSSTPGTPGTCS